MAKTIKFNLKCDNKQIRTLEDLQENFSIEDVLSYYDNKLLQRWLAVRGYKTELDDVNSIKSTDVVEIAKSLIKIFKVENESKNLEKEIYILKYQTDKEKRIKEYENNGYKLDTIIHNYEDQYNELIKEILTNPNDIALIKSNIKAIARNYSWIFKLHHKGLFWILAKKSKLAIMIILMENELRHYFLPRKLYEKAHINNVNQVEKEAEELKKKVFSKWLGPQLNTLFGVQGNDNSNNKYNGEWDIDYDIDKLIIFKELKNMVQEQSFQIELRDNLKIKTGYTGDKWINIEPKGKKFLIIDIGIRSEVRPAGDDDNEQSYDNLNTNFCIVDGIDYKSGSGSCKLLYMEI